MKTKRFRLLTVLLTAVMLVALSLNVMAASSNSVTRDGLTAQLFTDKDSYKSGESVKAAVQVDNHTGSDVFIFAQINVPEGVKLASESAAFDARLQEGESWTTPGGEILSAGGKTTTGTTATGDNMQAGFYIILTALAVCGIIALFVYGKNRKACLSIMLCLAMIGGMVVAAVPAQAADINGEIPLSCSITVDGKAAELTANVSYVIYDDEVAEESAEAPTATEAPEATEPPTATEAPEATEPPTATEAPEATEPPTATEAPEATEPPTATEAPEATEPPTATETPEATEPPTATDAPPVESTEYPSKLFIINGDFEKLAGENAFESWQADVTTNTHVATQNAHSGNYALQVGGKTDKVYQIFAVTPGISYELTGYVYLANSDGSDARVGFTGYSQNEMHADFQIFTEEVRFTDYASSNQLTLENDTIVRGEWMKFSYTVEVAEGTAYLVVHFTGQSGITLFDDISLRTVKMSDDYLFDSKFEYPDGENAFKYWEEQNVKVATENTHSGSYALQVENKSQWGRQFFKVDPGAVYEVTGYVRLAEGDTSNARVKFEGYSQNEINAEYNTFSKEVAFGSYASYPEMTLENNTLVRGEWMQFSWIVPMDAATEYFTLYLRGGSGVTLYDDVSVYKLKEADKLSIMLNSNFYYITEESGIATLLPNTGAYADLTGWTADCSILNGENTIWEEKNVDLKDGETQVSFNLTSCTDQNAEYIFKTMLYVDGLEMETEEWEFSRKHTKPIGFGEEGIYTEDGEIFHPVITYHMLNSLNDLNIVYECIEDFGINLFQFGKGFVQKVNWEDARAALDALEEKGAKAIACLYVGNNICSDPANKDLVTDYINEFKDHPAIYAWGIQDEPVGKHTEELIREAYEMVRELDPTRPVYTIDQREAKYPVLIRNADAVAIDNYPYGMFNAMEYIYDSAKYAVELASYSDKPIYTLLQCYPRHTGPYMDPNADADDKYLPTGNAMRNMIYQSLMAGTKGYGFYGFDYANTNDPAQPNMRDTETAHGIKEYAAKEKDIMFEYFVEDKYPTFNSNIVGLEDMRYLSFVRGGKVYMVILNKHEFAEQTVSVPLTSDNGKVTITGYTAMGYAGGATDTTGTGSTLDVTLEPGAAAVYIITPNEAVDWSEFPGGNNPEDTVPDVTVPDYVAPDDSNPDDTNPEDTDPSNTIVNGGFETLEGDNGFASWQADVPSNTHVDTTNAHSGTYALQVAGKADKVYQLFEVEAGATYELTGYIWLTAGDGNARVGYTGYNQGEVNAEYQTFAKETRFSYYGTESDTLGLTLEGNELVRGSWQKFSCKVTVPEGTTHLAVHFKGQSGITLVDDIAFRELECIANGGFETLEGDNGFASWQADVPSNTHVDTTNAHSGTYALQVAGKADKVYQLFEVEAGATYELTGYIWLTAGDGNARVGYTGYNQGEVNAEYQTFAKETRFSYYGTESDSLGLTLEGNELVRGNWQKFSCKVTVPEGTTHLAVHFKGQSGITLFDDISFR